MAPIIPQAAPIPPEAPLPVAMPPVSALPALWRQDRIARLTALAPEDARAGLLWLAMNHPGRLRRHARQDRLRRHRRPGSRPRRLPAAMTCRLAGKRSVVGVIVHDLDCRPVPDDLRI
jgi:hypothetical protein